ncbi:tetratricopeptide repeat protein [Myxococcota bacterium]
MDEERKLYLPYLLNALQRASFEGGLTLMEGDVQRIVLLRGGKPVNVISRLQEETLGRILLEEGKISSVDYNKLLDLLVKTKKPAGELLISMGLLGPQDVFLALEFQTRKKLLNCFRMVDFGFSLEQKSIPPEQMIANLEVEEAVFSGIQTTYSVDRLLSEFPVDEETVFVSRKPPQGRQVKMGPRENKLHRSIGTGSPMGKLMAVEGDLQQLLSVLYALHALYLVDAAGIGRPSTSDLELPGLEDEKPALVAPPVAAPEPEPEPGGSQPSSQSEGEPEPESFPRAPTLDDVLQANGVTPLLAEKVLSLARGDHFSVMEISRDTPTHELKSAFFALLRKYKLQDINSSYTTEKDRDMAQRLLDRATVAYRELENEETREAYVQALEQNADLQSRDVPTRVMADVEAQKGELACGAKHYQEAIEHYREAIKLYPNEPSYHFQLGLAGYKQVLGEIPETQRVPDHIRKPFLKAMAMNPRYDMPRLYLGYISKRNGDLKRAIKEFEGVVECNPENSRAQSEIRVLKRRLEDDK